MPIFKTLSRIYLSKFVNFVRSVNVIKNQVLFRQGDLADRVYIIKEGQFEISRQIKERSKHYNETPT